MNSQSLPRALVQQHGLDAGLLEKQVNGQWAFGYHSNYAGPPVSLTLPVRGEAYLFDDFPSVFEGLLPEGPRLEALLKLHKIDRNDSFRQLIQVGGDLVGSLTVHELSDES